MLLLTPDRVNDMMKSVEAKVREYGWLPGLHTYNRFSQGMVGDHMVPIVADAWLKGYRGFDVEFLYRAIRTKATEMPKEPIPAGAARSGLKEYLELGYVAADKDRESASKTLEFAYDDWCIAMLARALGKTDDYGYFLKRAGNYRNLWDPGTGFMRPKLANGQFLELLPSEDRLLETKTEGSHTWYAWFDPLLIGRAPNRHFTESNAWPYVWAVQQDVRGLINLLGGNEKFNARLDTFFHAPVNENGYKYVGTVGTIGQYVHGNQPSHHIAYLYSYSGQPWKTQYYTRYICENLYKAGPGGLCGNEDMGSLSSWYVFTSIGFYPVTPCSDYYVFSSPTFDKATVRLGNGKTFTVTARNNSKTNLYIQGAVLNGKAITRTWLTWEELNNGGSLVFDMGPEPSSTFGTGANDLPPATVQ
jgi:predicted alpha-1,2-mannosidase